MSRELTGKELASALAKLIAESHEHFGSNGNVHLPATFERAGFMSPEDKNALDMRGRYAITVSDGADILALNAGLYIARSFKNRPLTVDDSLCIVEISAAGQGAYKKIEFNWISAGKRYERYIYNSIDSGWSTEEWLTLPLKSGFSGYCLVKREKNSSSILVEMKFEVEKSSDISAGNIFAELPEGYTLTEAKPLYETGIAFIKGTTTMVPVSIVIGGTKDLQLYRMTSDSITRVMGHVMFSR